MSDIQTKVDELNRLLEEVQSYKREHPDERTGYYSDDYGSLLNAYREGDLAFDECVELLGKRRQKKELYELTVAEMRDNAYGELVLAIGEGKFRSVLYQVIELAVRSGYARGRHDAEKAAGEVKP